MVGRIKFSPKNMRRLSTIDFDIQLSLHLYQLGTASKSASKMKTTKTAWIGTKMRHFGQVSMHHCQLASKGHQKPSPRKCELQSVGVKALDFETLYEVDV